MSETDGSTTLPPPTKRNWLWMCIQIVLQSLFTLWFRYRAYGVKRVPTEQGALLLVNHQSFLDPLLVGLPLRRPISFMARDSLFKVPIIGWILRNTYVFPINRDSASATSMKTAIERMKHGFLVGLFPEGTRTRDGNVLPFKPGVISLIRRGKVPVYPVGIAGAHQAMPRNSLIPRPSKIRVVFGEPLTQEDLAPYLKKGQEEELMALLQSKVEACQQQAHALGTSEQ